MNTKRFVVLLITVALFTAPGYAQQERYFSDHRYIAPIEPDVGPDEQEKVLRDRRFPIDETVVKEWVDRPMPTWTDDAFQPASPFMKQRLADMPAHYVAMGRTLALEAAEVFDAPVKGEDGYISRAAIVSPGAHALRLKVVLAGLRHDEQLWVLDGEGRAAFGPYGAGDVPQDEVGLWLPTVLGERIVLVLKTPRDVLPLMMINALSHFHKPVTALTKQFKEYLRCNIPISQETSDTVQEISTGICMIIVPVGNDQAACSASLLNSVGSSAPPPYVLSAWHCFGNAANYSGVEAYWDYRIPPDSNTIPELYDVPRNSEANLVAYNTALDAVLIRLQSTVDVGEYGRAWIGWDTVELMTGDAVQTIHHPMAATMMTSRGAVTGVGIEVCMNVSCSVGYEEQIQATWSEGVTEPGSSGAALLSMNNNYRITGMLSNGNKHSCASNANNFDNFASFSRFFPQIGCHLYPDYECGDPYESERSSCCLIRMLGLKTETLDLLRRFRDHTLSTFPVGKQLIQEYYRLSPVLEPWVEHDIIARTIAEIAVTLGAAWAATL